MTSPQWKRLKDDWIRSPDRILSHVRVHFPPIDVVYVCQALGVELRGAPDSTWSAALKSNETQAIIWVDTEEELTRQRFSIAHELGHLFLHPTGQMFRCTGAHSDDPREAEANKFALKMLIPKHLLLARSAFFGRSTQALGQVFVVPPQMVAIRMKELNIGM